MLEFKTDLREVIEPLVGEAVKRPLEHFTEKHPHIAELYGLNSETFRRTVATRSAAHFAKHTGSRRWRGIINQNNARQIAVEVSRTTRQTYSARTQLTTVHTEILQNHQ